MQIWNKWKIYLLNKIVNFDMIFILNLKGKVRIFQIEDDKLEIVKMYEI